MKNYVNARSLLKVACYSWVQKKINGVIKKGLQTLEEIAVI